MHHRPLRVDLIYGASGMPSQGAPIWPAIIEKAYALTLHERASYPAITGLSCTEALFWLTGLKTDFIKLRDTWSKQDHVGNQTPTEDRNAYHFGKIQSAYKAGELVVLHIGGHAFELQEVADVSKVLVGRCTAMVKRSGIFYFGGKVDSPMTLRIPADRITEMVGAYGMTCGARQAFGEPAACLS